MQNACKCNTVWLGGGRLNKLGLHSLPPPSPIWPQSVYWIVSTTVSVFFFLTVRVKVALIIGISGHNDGLKINFARSVCESNLWATRGKIGQLILRVVRMSSSETVISNMLFGECHFRTAITPATFVPRNIAEPASRVLA